LLDKVFVSSSFNLKTFLESGVHEDKLEILHGGIDTDIFHPLVKINKHLPTKRLIGEEPISPESPFTILQVGKYELRKASYESVHGFLQTMENHPLRESVQLKVKWSTNVRSRSVQEIKAEMTPIFLKYPKAAKRVFLLEDRDIDMVSLYNNSDCFLFPSRSEGIGLPLLEAMACGIPCITTNYGSLSDYNCSDAGIILPNHGLEPMNDSFYGLNSTRDGEWGVVKAEDISNAILDVVEDSRKLYEYSKKGREHSLKFSYKATGKRLLSLLKEE